MYIGATVIVLVLLVVGLVLLATAPLWSRWLANLGAYAEHQAEQTGRNFQDETENDDAK